MASNARDGISCQGWHLTPGMGSQAIDGVSGLGWRLRPEDRLRIFLNIFFDDLKKMFILLSSI